MPTDFLNLSTSQVAALLTSEIAAITTEEIQVIVPDQVVALSTGRFELLRRTLQPPFRALGFLHC